MTSVPHRPHLPSISALVWTRGQLRRGTDQSAQGGAAGVRGLAGAQRIDSASVSARQSSGRRQPSGAQPLRAAPAPRRGLATYGCGARCRATAPRLEPGSHSAGSPPARTEGSRRDHGQLRQSRRRFGLLRQVADHGRPLVDRQSVLSQSAADFPVPLSARHDRLGLGGVEMGLQRLRVRALRHSDAGQLRRGSGQLLGRQGLEDARVRTGL